MESTQTEDIRSHLSQTETIENFASNHSILCRETQIAKLLSFCGKRHQFTPGSLFVYGHTSSGKSLTLQSFFSYFKLPHVLINCIECVSTKFLIEHCLMSVQSYLQKDSHDKEGAKESDSVHCDSMTDFVRMLSKLVSESHLWNETFYLIFDKAERLRDAHYSLLPALLRLQELTTLNICSIFISEIVWEKFHSRTGFWEPVCLHFPDYTKRQLQAILCLDCPHSCDKDLHAQYVNIVLSVFSMLCHDLKELRHLTKLNLAYFLEPINSGAVNADEVVKIYKSGSHIDFQNSWRDSATITDTRKLWKNIEPHLKRSLQSVYLREISSHQWEKKQEAHLSSTYSEDVKPTTARIHVELPYYSKFLLIAAYLASYNPMKYDRRFFAKNAGKISKRAKLIKKNERTSSHLLGPKLFPLDRLMAIFYSIVEGRVIPSALITVQISSLVSLNLLSQSGGDDKISAPKYKCMVDLDFIQSIARTVQFDVMQYLFDFL